MKLSFWIILIVGLLPGLLLLLGGFSSASGLPRRSLPQEVQAEIARADFVITKSYVGSGRYKVQIYPTRWKITLLMCGLVLYLAGALFMLRGQTP